MRRGKTLWQAAGLSANQMVDTVLFSCRGLMEEPSVLKFLLNDMILCLGITWSMSLEYAKVISCICLLPPDKPERSLFSRLTREGKQPIYHRNKDAILNYVDSVASQYQQSNTLHLLSEVFTR